MDELLEKFLEHSDKIRQYGVKHVMDRHLFNRLSEDEQIEFFVKTLEHHSKDKSRYKEKAVKVFRYILSDHPELFMQVGEQILDMYDQYFLDTVPKPGEQRIPNVTSAEYKKWYMKICIAAIKNDIALVDMVDPDILDDKEFVTMAVRENIDPGSDMEELEREYDKNVVNFVKNVIALKNLRVTNRRGSQGITHERMRVLPRGKVEEFLGLTGGTKHKSKKSSKSKKSKSNKSKHR